MWGTGMRMNILFVDDDRDTCEMIEFIFNQFGHKVYTAMTVAAALSMARSGRFDVYITDGKFPDGTGVELCRQLRSISPGTPILFYSGLVGDGDIEAAMNAGAHAYLTKPCELDDLRRTVESLLEKDLPDKADSPATSARTLPEPLTHTRIYPNKSC
jgi:DNA-binding response OmpR family regulator